MIGTNIQRRAKSVPLLSGLILTVLVSAGVLLAATPVHADTTFTVNSSADREDQAPGDGKCFTGEILVIGDQCTLRAAIQEANAFPGTDTIDFDIPTTGVATISPGSGLPLITRRVTIDGYTQGAATPNSIPPTQAGTNPVLKFRLVGSDAGLGLGDSASNSVVRGLAIDGCVADSCRTGITLLGGTGYKIQGNFIGVEPDGTSHLGNIWGVILRGGTQGSTIGGASPAARNLISANIFEGVLALDRSSGNTIQGNLIGLDKDGNPLGNGGAGVGLIFAGNGNRILSNSLSSNGGLGIDLSSTNAADGVTANDPKDPDTGPNRLQNYPLITSAITFGPNTVVKGTLNSTPSTKLTKRSFIVQFFGSPSEDPSRFGEGKAFLGQTQVSTDGQGNASFSFAPPRKVSEGQFVTATATERATGDTSEFSRAKVVEPPVVQP